MQSMCSVWPIANRTARIPVVRSRIIVVRSLDIFQEDKVMPDVFKILKDLELKSVGLDPQTNKMQEGYFVSFRTVGLPIHKEDFANPYSPLGVNLEKDIPKADPSDPKGAPKTGSDQMDENKIFTA